MRKIYFAAAILIVSCTAKKVLMTQADADRAATKFPGATLASLNEGQKHYEDNCGKCHALFKPTEFSEAHWLEKIPPMAEKASISGEQERLIKEYLLTAREGK